MALSGVRSLLPDQSFDVTDAAFVNAAYLPEEGNRTFQLAITRNGSDGFAFEVRSCEEQKDDVWVLHATGQLKRAPTESRNDSDKPQSVSLSELQSGLAATQDRAEFYEAIAKSGLQYGPAFQLVEQVWAGKGEALCRLRGMSRTRTGM